MNKLAWGLLIAASAMGSVAGWEWNGAVPFNTLLTLMLLSFAIWGAGMVCLWRVR